MPQHPPHPVTLMFPVLSGPAFRALVEDIRCNGLREPILLDPDGRVVDGRSRMRACEIAHVPPRFETWDGQGSAVALVLSRNLHRGHLCESQRAMVAACVRVMFEFEAQGRMRAGRAPAPEPSANLQKGPVHAATQAAHLLNVSPRSVAYATLVIGKGDEALIEAARNGAIKVSTAARLVRLPKERQRQIVALRPRQRAWAMAGLGRRARRAPPRALPPPGWPDGLPREALEAALAMVATLGRSPDLDRLGIDAIMAPRLQALAYEAMIGVEKLTAALEDMMRAAAPKEAAA